MVSPVVDPPFYTDRLPDGDDTPDAQLAWLLPPKGSGQIDAKKYA
jgi:hypothetical protein